MGKPYSWAEEARTMLEVAPGVGDRMCEGQVIGLCSREGQLALHSGLVGRQGHCSHPRARTPQHRGVPPCSRVWGRGLHPQLLERHGVLSRRERKGGYPQRKPYAAETDPPVSHLAVGVC